jgi:hypothetical protein
MKVKIGLVVLAVLLVGFFVSCDVADTAIIGKWGTNGTIIYTFTADSIYPASATSTGVTDMKYTASGGKGKVWMAIDTLKLVVSDFTYTVSGTTLTLTPASGLNPLVGGTYTKIP